MIYKNEILPFITMWMNLLDIMLAEIMKSYGDKQILYDLHSYKKYKEIKQKQIFMS